MGTAIQCGVPMHAQGYPMPKPTDPAMVHILVEGRAAEYEIQRDTHGLPASAHLKGTSPVLEAQPTAWISNPRAY